MRILYVVRGEARPQSWIIMIYGLAEREKKKSARERERENEREGKRRSFWMTSS